MSISLNKITTEKIEIKSEIKPVINFYQKIIKDHLDIKLKDKINLTKNKKYFLISSSNKENNNKIINFISEIKKNIICDDILNNVIKGIFVICGNISDPKNRYYLEFTNYNKDLISTLNQKLSDNNLIFNYKTNNKKHILYTTNSSIIEDFLTYIGASNLSLEIMNLKIYKDVRNKINRIVNCETSNINKIILASSNQIKYINKIVAKRGLSYLCDDLQEIAIKRLKNPEMSLSELSKILSFKISKSGLNHKLKKIEKISKEIED